jgi:hypothetical protein
LFTLGGAAADEVFKATTAITLPAGQKIISFDISFVDPVIGLYLLGDRTSNAVDAIDTESNTLTAQIGHGLFTGPGLCPPAKQPAGANDCAGPDGVLIVDHREAWVGDGDSTVKVFELVGGALTQTISTGGVHRADELCVDPRHNLVLVANNAESPFPFATVISTETYTVLKRITFDGNNGTPKATNGAEQCQWDPRTGKFYISIPEVNGPGNNTAPGGVAVIDPVSMKVEKTFIIPITSCAGPQGLAIGPAPQILLGCNAPGPGGNNPTAVIDEHNGHVIATLNNESGSDEVWFNPGDGHYFLARSSAVGPNQVLGIADARGDKTDTDAVTAPKGAPSSHSVAADSEKNQVYVPIGASAANTVCSSAGGIDAQGCIAVFTTTHNDRDDCTAQGSPVIKAKGDDGDSEHMKARCRDRDRD